ncbi:MAG: class I SAM-dependent methyltransferase [Chloroflexota bacterium]
MATDDLGRRMASAYDVVAAAYADRNSVMPPAYLDLGAPFIAQVGVRGRVLDVGCGAGRDLDWLLGQGVNVVGGDLSAGMLAQARARVAPHGDARLVRLDMCAQPFPDATFAGVWCSASLLHLPKQLAPRALAGMRRILAPSGPLLLGIQEGDGEGWETGAYDAPIERFFARYHPDEARALLATAGFEVQKLHTGEARNRRWLTYLSTRLP